MKWKQKAEYECRLARLTAGWFREARALDVLLQYEFTGITALAGPEGVLEAVDALVTRAIRAIGALEQEDRWLNLTVDRQPDRVRLACVSVGACRADLSPLKRLGAAVSLCQEDGFYHFTVDWMTDESVQRRNAQ